MQPLLVSSHTNETFFAETSLFPRQFTENDIHGNNTQDVTHDPCTEKRNWTQNFTSEQNAIVTDTWWKRKNQLLVFSNSRVDQIYCRAGRMPRNSWPTENGRHCLSCVFTVFCFFLIALVFSFVLLGFFVLFLFFENMNLGR